MSVTSSLIQAVLILDGQQRVLLRPADDQSRDDVYDFHHRSGLAAVSE